MKKGEITLNVEPLRKTLIRMEIIGKDDIVLNKLDRVTEMAQVFKQSHDPGVEIPKHLKTSNMWQFLITSINWEKPIVFHDEDPELYSEEEWKEYMTNNRPCLTTYAFKKSLEEAFKSFGFKERTGKAGTDLSRTLSFLNARIPVEFASVTHNSKIVQTKGAFGGSSVVCHENVFSNWSTEIEVVIPNGVFPPETIVSLVRTAGEFLGIGSRRKHGFGRYTLGDVYIDKDYNPDILQNVA